MNLFIYVMRRLFVSSRVTWACPLSADIWSRKSCDLKLSHNKDGGCGEEWILVSDVSGFNFESKFVWATGEKNTRESSRWSQIWARVRKQQTEEVKLQFLFQIKSLRVFVKLNVFNCVSLGSSDVYIWIHRC